MIYLVHGNDALALREKSHELLRALSAKRPDAEVFRLTLEDWSEGKLNELVESQGLFEHKYIVALDTLLSSNESSKEVAKEIAAVLLSKLEELERSENVFILIEGEVDAKTLAKIEKHAKKIWKCDEKEIKERKDFNVFALTDALGRRDKKSLWVTYEKAILRGLEPEELHGLLFWQVKNLLIASKSKSAEESGQKPFVWSKSRSFLKNFTEEELKQVSSSLLDIYHNARRGIVDFDIALEKFILQV